MIEDELNASLDSRCAKAGSISVILEKFEVHFFRLQIHSEEDEVQIAERKTAEPVHA